MAKQKTVLIVDDDSDVLNLLKEFLVEKQFNTLEAENGTKALEIAQIEKPDMLITDLLLPGIHGIDLVKTVKSTYKIPVIVISGIYKGGELSDFLESENVDAYFIKPLNLNLLYNKINSLLNE
jgi:DNA-binding response OmpR family regulator